MNKYKLSNFKIDKEHKIEFVSDLRKLFNLSLTDSLSMANGLLNDHSEYLTTYDKDIVQHLKNFLPLSFDMVILDQDEDKLEKQKAKTPADLWYDSLSIQEQEHVQELALKYGLQPARG